MDQDTNGLVAAAGEGSGALPSTFKYRVAENTSGAATETYKDTESTEGWGGDKHKTNLWNKKMIYGP